MPPGQPLHQRRQGRGIANSVGNRHRQLVAHDCVLRVSAHACRQQPDDTYAVAYTPARDFQPGNNRQRLRRKPPAALAPPEIGVVHAHRAHLDERLADRRRRTRDLLDLQHLRATERLNDDGSHARTLPTTSRPTQAHRSPVALRERSGRRKPDRFEGHDLRERVVVVVVIQNSSACFLRQSICQQGVDPERADPWIASA